MKYIYYWAHLKWVEARFNLSVSYQQVSKSRQDKRIEINQCHSTLVFRTNLAHIINNSNSSNYFFYISSSCSFYLWDSLLLTASRPVKTLKRGGEWTFLNGGVIKSKCMTLPFFFCLPRSHSLFVSWMFVPEELILKQLSPIKRIS